VDIRPRPLRRKTAKAACGRAFVLEGRNGRGNPSIFSASYAVGADGARSIMRRAAGYPISPAHPATSRFYWLAEAVSLLDAPPGTTIGHNCERGWLGLICGAPRRRPFITKESVVDAPVSCGALRACIALFETCGPRAARIAGTDFRPRHDPIWASRVSQMKTRARRAHYRKGRISPGLVMLPISMRPMGWPGAMINVGIQERDETLAGSWARVRAGPLRLRNCSTTYETGALGRLVMCSAAITLAAGRPSSGKF